MDDQYRGVIQVMDDQCRGVIQVMDDQLTIFYILKRERFSTSKQFLAMPG